MGFLSSRVLSISGWSCNVLNKLWLNKVLICLVDKIVLLKLSFRSSLNVDAIISIFLIAYLVDPLSDRTIFATPSLPGDWCKGFRFQSLFSSFVVVFP